MIPGILVKYSIKLFRDVKIVELSSRGYFSVHGVTLGGSNLWHYLKFSFFALSNICAPCKLILPESRIINKRLNGLRALE